ncbi:YigZ family protein [Catenovulum sp. SM1970]|nr:YigZ family protein [Marinifaba aquimaris]
MNPTPYSIPAKSAEFVEEIKKSRFITELHYVANNEQAKQKIAEIKQQHPTARHHCSAFVAGPPHDGQQYGFSDDGEPSGTAGKPMLATLQGSGLGHILAVTTRYSGGIKLGTGGLVKAYGGGVKQALERLESKIFVPKSQFKIQCQYGEVDQVNFLIKQFEGELITTNYQDSVEIHLALPQMNSDNLEQSLQPLQLLLIPLD